MHKLNVCTIFLEIDNNEHIRNLNLNCLSQIIKYYVINKKSKTVELQFLYKYFTGIGPNLISSLFDECMVEYGDEVKVKTTINENFRKNLDNILKLAYSQMYLYNDSIVLVNVAFGRELILMNISDEDFIEIKNIINKTLYEISKIKNENIKLISNDFQVGYLNLNYYITLSME